MNKIEFTHIYQSLYPLLYRYINKLSKNTEVAKDICQEAFLKLYTEISKDKEIEFTKSWLFKCATNDFLNRIKREKIISFVPYSSKNETYEFQNPEEKYIKKEKRINLERALSNLNSSERQLIYLYQEGFSYAEISHITGIKLTSVGKTLSRTIQKISTQLQKTKCYELL